MGTIIFSGEMNISQNVIMCMYTVKKIRKSGVKPKLKTVWWRGDVFSEKITSKEKLWVVRNRQINKMNLCTVENLCKPLFFTDYWLCSMKKIKCSFIEIQNEKPGKYWDELLLSMKCLMKLLAAYK